jgi:hypothetical protein
MCRYILNSYFSFVLAFRHPEFARWKSELELLDKIKASERKPKASKATDSTRTGSPLAKSGSNSSIDSQKKPRASRRSASITKTQIIPAEGQQGTFVSGNVVGDSSSSQNLQRQLHLDVDLETLRLENQHASKAQMPMAMPPAATSTHSYQGTASFFPPLTSLQQTPLLSLAAQSSLFLDESTTEQLGSRHMLQFDQHREDQRQEQIPYNWRYSSQPNQSVPDDVEHHRNYQQPASHGLIGHHQSQQHPPQPQKLHPYGLQLPNIGVDTYFDAGQIGSHSSEKDLSRLLPPDNWNLLEPTPFAPGDDGTRRRLSLDTRTRPGSTTVNETKSPDKEGATPSDATKYYPSR